MMGKHSWVSTNTQSCGNLRSRGVKCGRDVDGSDIFLGRARYRGDILPAKVVLRRRSVYVSYAGSEKMVDNFEMLLRPENGHCKEEKWVRASEDNIPVDAFPVGETSNGETLYAGRVYAKGAQSVGKVHPSHRCCYIPFDGKEEKHKNYEILILK